MRRKITIWPFFIVLITACNNQTPQQRLVDFVNDRENKITQSIEVGEVYLVSRWLPQQYRNLAANVQTDNSYYYFNVKLQKKAVEKPDNGKIIYLNFDMQKDFVLVCEGDSIRAAFCQKIENGVGGSYEYMLAFDNDNGRIDKKDFTVVYNDKIFGIGSVGFLYKYQDIRRIPRL